MPRRTWRKLRPRWSLSVEQLEEKLPLAFGDLLGTLDGPSTATQALAEAAYSLAADGDLIVVGAPRADINGTIDAGSVDVRDRGTGDLIRTISNPTPAANDRFGFSVDISGDRLVVGTYQDDAAGVDAGAVYVFDLTSGALLHTLFNPSPAAFDQFGFDVAISGDLILVGAPLANNFAVEAGAAFVFDATTGSLLHALANPDGPSVTYFGSAVDISGNAVAVGAYRNDTGASDAGSVFLYDATTGGLQRQLANPTPAAAEYFGFSLAISGDDLVVGAHRDVAGTVGSGAALLYDFPTGQLRHTLVNPSPAVGDNFGFAVDITASTVVVGAYRDDAGAFNAGTAYQYNTQTGALVRQLPNPSPTDLDYFGSAVAIAGSDPVIGSYWDDTFGVDAGTAHVFDGVAGGLRYLISSAAVSSFDQFGWATAMSGHRLVVGSLTDDSAATDAGRVDVYDMRDQSLLGTLLNPTPFANDNFGNAVAIDGNIIAVGAYRDDVGATNAGVVHVFDATTFALIRTIVNPTPASNDGFGFAIALQGNTLAVGAYRDSEAGTESGAIHVFDVGSGQLWRTIVAPNPSNSGRFGSAVALRDNLVVASAPTDDHAANNAGSVYVFEWSTGQLVHTIRRTVPADFDGFGRSLAVFGTRLVVGADGVDVGGQDAGEAYLYDLNTGGLIRTLGNPQAAATDFFGSSVAISSERIAVGAPLDDGVIFSQGAVHLFNAATGEFVATLTAPSPRAGDGMGASLALNDQFLAAGAPQTDGVTVDRGAVLLFDTRSNTPPDADAGGPYLAPEGTPVALDASASFDAESPNSELTFEWDLDYDGLTFDVDLTGITPSVSFPDNFVDRQLAVRVTDDQGLSDLATGLLTVTNVPPLIDVNSDPIAADEGMTAANTGSFSDPGAGDTVSLTASIGTVVDLGSGQWSWSWDTTDGPDDSQTVTITATDDDGGVTPVEFTLNVDNVAPMIASNSGVITVLAGTTAVQQGTYGDPGDDTISLASSVGDILDNGDGTWSWLFDTTAITDSQIVVVTVTDSDNASTAVQFDLIVTQIVADQAVTTVPEGAMVHNTGQYLVTGTAPVLSASVGTVVDVGNGTWSWSYDTVDGPDDTQVVTITADYAGDIHTTDFTLNVDNVAPAISADANLVQVLVGTTAVNGGTYDDPGADTVTLVASFGTVTDNLDGTWSWSGDTTSLGDTQLVTITITDSDTASTEVTFDLVVSQVAVDSPLVTVDEGSTATNTGGYLDTGTAPVLTASLGTVLDLGSGQLSWSWDTTDGPLESQPVTITADYGGGEQYAVVFDLVVNNLPPQLIVDQASLRVDEGQPAANSGTFSDAGVNDVVTLSASIGTVVDTGNGTWSWTFDTTDGPDESQVVTITATDNDGGVTTRDFTLDVDNVAPAISADANLVQVLVGTTAVNGGTYDDPGADTVTLVASFGTVTDNLDGTWSWSGDTTSLGDTQLVTITITDSDTASTEVTFDLVVSQVAVDSPLVTVDEGSTATNTGGYFDTGTAPVLSASVGTVVDVGNGTWSWSYDTVDGPDDTQVVTITADYAGDIHTTDFTLNVDNVAPAISADANLVQVLVGTTAVNGGTYDDPGADTVTLVASFGTVTDNLDGTWSWSGDTTSLGDTQLVTITITDSDTASTEVTFDLVVSQVAVDSPLVTVDEGSTATNTGGYLDTGTAPVLTASVGTVLDLGSGQLSWSWDTTDGPLESQPVTITADYGGGEQYAVVFDLVVNNLPPQLIVDQASLRVDEGQPAANSGTFSDAGVNDVVTLSASIGTVVDTGNGTWSWTFDTTDGPDESQVVTITATDNDGGVTTRDFTLDVDNVAPAISADANLVQVLVGTTAVNGGTYDDPGADTVTLVASFGTVTDNLDGTWSWSGDTTSLGDTQLVTITITDSDTASTEVTFDLVVSQVAVDSPLVTVDEGSTATNTGGYFDTGTAPVLSASVGTVVDVGNGTWSWSYDTVDGPDDTQVVTITADYAGDIHTTDFTLNVDNVAPAISADANLVQVLVGTTAVNGGTYDDPGADTVTLVASFGTVTDNLDGTWSWSGDTTSLGDTQLVTITITDSDTASTEVTFDLVVSQVAVDSPLVTVDEGSTATNTGGYLDTGTAPVLTASLGTVLDLGSGQLSWSWDTTDGPLESQQVTITADYGGGQQYDVAFDLVVNNLPPQLIVDQSSLRVDEGQPAANSGTFSDAGVNDVVTLSASIGTVVDTGNGTWSWTFDTTDGPDESQVVTITATDNDGGVTTRDFTLDVDNVAPAISADANLVQVLVGTTAVNGGTYDDPGADTVTLVASFGTVTDNLDGTWSWSGDTTSLGDTQLVTITITDSDTASTEVTFDLVVSQVAVDSPLVTVDEGSTATNTGGYLDTGTAPVLAASLGTVLDLGSGQLSWSWDTTDGPLESQQVTITADYGGGEQYDVAFDLVVDNLPPQLIVDQASLRVDEGQPAANSGTFSDAGVNDVVTLSASIGTVVDTGNGTWSWTFDTTDGPDESQVVTITATDNDGGVTTRDFTLDVDNVAPVLTLNRARVRVAAGATAMNGGTYFDAGDDAVTLTASIGQVVDHGDGTWSWSLDTTSLSGAQWVTITITDSDNQTTEMQFRLIVTHPFSVDRELDSLFT